MGDKISFSFADPESSKIYIINSGGTSKEIIASVGSKPQKTQAGNIVYRGYGDQIESININGSGKQVLFNDSSAVSFSKLSFNDKKIVGEKSGESGIWIIDITGSNKVKLR